MTVPTNSIRLDSHKQAVGNMSAAFFLMQALGDGDEA
jgi:hypothetical protein